MHLYCIDLSNYKSLILNIVVVFTSLSINCTYSIQYAKKSAYLCYTYTFISVRNISFYCSLYILCEILLISLYFHEIKHVPKWHPLTWFKIYFHKSCGMQSRYQWYRLHQYTMALFSFPSGAFLSYHLETSKCEILALLNLNFVPTTGLSNGKLNIQHKF